MPVLAVARACRHELVQDVHGVLAVLAGGVDVAADVGPVLGGVVAGRRPEIFCWVVSGRAGGSRQALWWPGTARRGGVLRQQAEPDIAVAVRAAALVVALADPNRGRDGG